MEKLEIEKILTGLKRRYGKDPFNIDLSVKSDFIFYVVEFYETASRDILKRLKEVVNE